MIAIWRRCLGARMVLNSWRWAGIQGRQTLAGKRLPALKFVSWRRADRLLVPFICFGRVFSAPCRPTYEHLYETLPCCLESPLVHLLGLVNDHYLAAMLGSAYGVE